MAFTYIGQFSLPTLSSSDSEVAKALAELPLASLGGLLPEPTEIFAYRSVELRGGIITSQNDTTPWRVKDGLPYLRADCNRGHQAPEESCSCGIYAWKKPLDTEKFGGSLVVKVQLWGAVIEHVAGYRAEHAAIVGVLDTSEQAQQLAEAYELEWLPGALKPMPPAAAQRKPFWQGLFGA